MATKKQDILKLAKKKGNNADLLLLDRIHEVEESVEDTQRDIKGIRADLKDLKLMLESAPAEKRFSDEVNIEKISTKLAVKMAKMEKGDPGHTPTKDELLSLIKPLIPFVQDEEDGHTPTESELLALISPLIEKLRNDQITTKEEIASELRKIVPQKEEIVKDIEERLPQLGGAVRNSLEILQGDERLDKKAVKGLDDTFEQLEERIKKTSRGRLGMRKVPIIKRHRLTDQVDGSTRSFTLPKDTVDIVAIGGSSFPFTFDDNDWTLAGNTLTLNNVPTPKSGQTLMAILEVLFYG